MSNVAVKCLDITQNTDCEGSLLNRNWRWVTKAWGANRIRYPGSPRRKRWLLVVGWNSKELTGARTSGGTCGLIRWYARNLTWA